MFELRVANKLEMADKNSDYFVETKRQYSSFAVVAAKN